MSGNAQGETPNAELAGVSRVVRMPAPVNPIRRGSLIDLAQQLEAVKASTRDVVADTRHVEMLESGELFVDGNGAQVEDSTYPLTHHAHAQLAERTGIPFRYYQRMWDGGHTALAARNVNEWLAAEPEKRLIRVADGKVRAILSDRYRVLDNFDLAMLTAGRAMQHKAEILECSLSEQRMSIKITVPEHRAKIGELTQAQKALFPTNGNPHAARPSLDADYVVPGLMVSNSEVGSGAFRVEPFVFRLVCWNGLVGQESLMRVHLGSRMDVGEIVYSDATRKLDDQALWSKVRDVIDATFNPDVFRGFVEKLRGAAQVQIAKPVEVTDAVAKNLTLSVDQKEALLRYFTVEGHSVYGLVNGITRLAQDTDDADAQIELERAAGSILAKPGVVTALA